MDHKLRVTVRLDIDLHWARMDVRGCLTEQNCRALLPIVRRSFRFLQEPNVVIDVSSAQHIDLGGVDALERLGITGSTAHPLLGTPGSTAHPLLGTPGSTAHPLLNEDLGTCFLIVPEVLPSCPSRFPRPHGSHRFAA
ncbi:hypothetical protein [Arthrobacter burdickii]|uniref:STAS domain-containing protein n=1 Tax=Arthrobacter burdickii TaxID=3035920 RepID=A0ABT8K1I1_9MICC|nr:hypothetical protein [Arthrobacter burdickii]MDN4611289.1 hypothetical protein [Arthrobacter burdickii]